jgi:hypothetical protein
VRAFAALSRVEGNENGRGDVGLDDNALVESGVRGEVTNGSGRRRTAELSAEKIRQNSIGRGCDSFWPA